MGKRRLERKVGLLQLLLHLFEPSVDALFVLAGGAGQANATNHIITDLDRYAAIYRDHVRQCGLLHTARRRPRRPSGMEAWVPTSSWRRCSRCRPWAERAFWTCTTEPSAPRAATPASPPSAVDQRLRGRQIPSPSAGLVVQSARGGGDGLAMEGAAGSLHPQELRRGRGGKGHGESGGGSGDSISVRDMIDVSPDMVRLGRMTRRIVGILRPGWKPSVKWTGSASAASS